MGIQKNQGFTLVELMIVVAIIGILAAVGIPSYQSYVMESRRADAYTALSLAAAEQERFYTYDNRYASNIDEIGGSTSPDGYYTLSLTATDSSFTLTATPANGSSQDNDSECASFSINHLGLKTASRQDGSPTNECW